MSALPKAGEIVLEMILGALSRLPIGQRRRVLDAARERLEFDAVGQAKLDAHNRKKKAAARR